MRYIPLLFSAPMIRSIIDGSKTQTRRTKGLETPNNLQYDFTGWELNPTLAVECKKTGDDIEKDFKGLFAEFNQGEWLTKCPYSIGDIIWVRETWQQHCIETKTDENTWAALEYTATGQYVYRADNYILPIDSIAFGKWKPSIFMPKSACRLFLQIKWVWVEKLNDITEKDAIAEGVEVIEDFGLYKNYQSKAKNDIDTFIFSSPIDSFRTLWNSINGPESWDDNPYVWMIEFEKIEKPADF